MKFIKQKKYWISLIIVTLIAALSFTGCDSSGSGDADTPDTTPPVIVSTFPENGATGVEIISNITARFNEGMAPATIIAANFTLYDNLTPISGTVTYNTGDTKAIFTPAANLQESITYTATVTTGVKDVAGNALAEVKVWTFTTGTIGATSPAPVDLGTAGNYAILAKSAISTVPTSAITGDLGLSPAATSFITGFSLVDDTGFATSSQVTGFVYGADMAPPTDGNLTTAVSDMEAAYTEAATRPTPDFLNRGSAGNIGGLILGPGLYNWTTAVSILSDVTIKGLDTDVWIFQIPSTLTVGNNFDVILDGALAKNIFWQVAEEVAIGTGAHFEGNILCLTSITLGTGASMYGRALAQTRVDLDQNAFTEPAP